MRKLLPVVAALALAAPAAPAAASQVSTERRILVAIASHDGARGDARLRYAGRDAARFADVLRELGGVHATEARLLEDPTPGEVRGALGTVAAHVAELQAAGTRTTLFVYYSGHADRRALHLGNATLPHSELRSLVAATGAPVRVVLLDACESGGITRKGVTPVQPFELSVETPGVEGEVVITSSASDEASLESDQLAGSFFTHHLVAGLRGAADRDDGQVTLEEAYTYAYRMTVADTGATRAGPQHPSFELELRGMGALVLTDLRPARGAPLGRVALPAGEAAWMVLSHRDGPAVASLPPSPDAARALVLPAGTYWLRRRGGDALEEAALEVVAGQTTDATGVALHAVAYADVVRKGLDPDRLAAHSLLLGTAMETAGLDGLGPLGGAALGWRLDLPRLFVQPSVELKTGASSGTPLRFSQDELALGLTAGLAIGAGPLAVLVGPSLRWIGVRQRFDADPLRGGVAEPTRSSWALAYGAGATVEVPAGARLSFFATTALELVRLRVEDEGVTHRPRFRALMGVALGVW